MGKKVVSEIDQRIKNAFQLFKGVRSEQEDQIIYDKVYDLCFDEALRFLEENLDDYRKAIIISNLETISSSILDEDRKNKMSLEIIMLNLENIEDYRFRLLSRLEYFVESLLL